MAPRIAGSIFTASEDAGDCHEFCRELERLMAEGSDPVDWRFGVDVKRLVVRGTRVGAVATSAGEIEADAFVLALGTAAPELLRPLGVRVPVYPLKGYSLTVPVTHEAGAPKVSVTDFKRKVVYARLGSELRVAGMADLAGRRAEIDPERVEQLVAEARAAFPDASDWRDVQPWCGLRPATPRGTPVLGATPLANLWLDVGHGALGFTLALAAGQLVADLIAGREPAVPLDGFRLGD
jgi:D-amino-acid dehydrogenase